MHEGEGLPDENFTTGQVSPTEEQLNNAAPGESSEGAQDNFQSLSEVSYDDPRVRSLMDNENLTAEEAIMRVRAEQTSQKREAE